MMTPPRTTMPVFRVRVSCTLSNSHPPRTTTVLPLSCACPPRSTSTAASVSASAAPSPRRASLASKSSALESVSHVPLGGWSQVIGVEVEQELSRPYAYVSRDDWAGDVSRTSKGIDIIDIKEPTKARVIYSWRIPNGEIHQGTGGQDSKYFKLKGRQYAVQSMRCGNRTDGGVGAVVVDVTA